MKISFPCGTTIEGTKEEWDKVAKGVSKIYCPMHGSRCHRREVMNDNNRIKRVKQEFTEHGTIYAT